jgi:putative flippase GtrA
MAAVNSSEEETIKREVVRQRPARFQPPRFQITESATPALAQSPADATPFSLLQARATAWLDRRTNGRGAEAMRVIMFLIVGGSASVVNLIFVQIQDSLFHPTGIFPVFVVSAVATEISLLYNFMLNDRFTFRALVQGQRTWVQRCIRFHGPASVGFVLTLLISGGIHQFGHLRLVVAQAIAIVIVTVVNFFMHRHWTYRETPPSESLAG